MHDLLTNFENYLSRNDSTQELNIIASAKAAQKGKQQYQKRGNTAGNNTYIFGRSTSHISSKKLYVNYAKSRAILQKSAIRFMDILRKQILHHLLIVHQQLIMQGALHKMLQMIGSFTWSNPPHH